MKISVSENTYISDGSVGEYRYKERHCKHCHSISGLQVWCDKGVFPPDCSTCDKGDWVEYEVVVTTTSTNLKRD